MNRIFPVALFGLVLFRNVSALLQPILYKPVTGNFGQVDVREAILERIIQDLKSCFFSSENHWLSRQPKAALGDFAKDLITPTSASRTIIN